MLVSDALGVMRSWEHLVRGQLSQAVGPASCLAQQKFHRFLVGDFMRYFCHYDRFVIWYGWLFWQR